jgi:hypothetical protein
MRHRRPRWRASCRAYARPWHQRANKRAEWHRLELGPKGTRIVRNTTCIAFKSVYRLNPNCLLGASAGFDPHTCVMIEPPIVLQVCILTSSKVRAFLFAPAVVIIYRSTWILTRHNEPKCIIVVQKKIVGQRNNLLHPTPAGAWNPAPSARLHAPGCAGDRATPMRRLKRDEPFDRESCSKLV